MHINTDKKTKRLALSGVLIAVAFILNYLETLLPSFIPIPGIKLGFSNIAVLVSLYSLGPSYGIAIAVVRILLSGFTYGSLFSVLYSLSGCLLSILAMILAKRFCHFSVIGVSILGGVLHNLGQTIVALFLVGPAILYYAPILIVSGIVAGLITGAIAGRCSAIIN